jgi:hypothetical protein
MAMPNPKPDDVSVGLADLARRALAEEDGDEAKALLAMRRYLREDKKLYDRLIEPMIDDRCDAALRHIRRDGRRALLTLVQNPPANADQLMEALGRTLLDMPLPGKPKTRMGDATSADLQETAQYCRTHERTWGWNARWMELIDEAKHPDKKVADSLTHADLERLRKRAEEG